MGFLEKNRNLVFWILQFVGWGILSVASLLLLPEVSKAYVFYTIISVVFVSVGTTSLLRWYIKRAISFDGFSLADFIKIAVATLITSIVFAVLNYVVGYLAFKFSPNLTDLEIRIFEAMNKLGLIIFSSVFNVLLWLGCYLAAKFALRFNANRIERLELNASLKQAQLNTLKGQINPHFMFNSLNNIRGLMLEDVERSREMLTKLSEMLRYSLTKNNVDAIALAEELEMVENYIDLSKIQFEDRLQFTKQIDPETTVVQIPPMIVQLLVENAAKHGIANLKEGGIIVLETKKAAGQLHIVVENSGKLKIAKNSTQLGLKNIKQRLKLLYGDKASFVLQEKDNTVQATIKIPL